MTTPHDHEPPRPEDHLPGIFEPAEPSELAGGPAVASTPDGEPDELIPINWNQLTAEQAQAAWLDLNSRVTWLRKAFGLPPTIVPPLWHRHDELVWELSALHLHWLACYDPDASPSAPIAWMRDFADARGRLRESVAACGTRLERDRPTRIPAWPGEEPDPEAATAGERQIVNRDEDFAAFVMDDLAARRKHFGGGS